MRAAKWGDEAENNAAAAAAVYACVCVRVCSDSAKQNRVSCASPHAHKHGEPCANTGRLTSAADRTCTEAVLRQENKMWENDRGREKKKNGLVEAAESSSVHNLVFSARVIR